MNFSTKLLNLFRDKNRNEEFFEDLEDILIQGDIGVVTAMEATEELRNNLKKGKYKDKYDFQSAIKKILSKYIKAQDLQLNKDALNILLVLGVNGVGKTTTIAKLADYYKSNNGYKTILSAGDTFRAAAIDQLKMHGERLGIRVVGQNPGADPGAVIYDSIESAKAKGENLILADTAGRMHNKSNLVRELQKIDKIIVNRLKDGVYKKILIIDSTTGQNGFRQAETFNEAVGIDSIILTKYDSEAKGGIAVSISKTLGIPFSFICTGEKYSDIKLFEIEEYLDVLLGMK